jgi:hypothetical protein
MRCSSCASIRRIHSFSQAGEVPGERKGAGKRGGRRRIGYEGDNSALKKKEKRKERKKKKEKKKKEKRKKKKEEKRKKKERKQKKNKKKNPTGRNRRAQRVVVH